MSEAEEYFKEWATERYGLPMTLDMKQVLSAEDAINFTNSYHQHKMREMLEEMDGWAEDKYPTRDGKLCYNIARIEACNELLNHLKTKIKE